MKSGHLALGSLLTLIASLPTAAQVPIGRPMDLVDAVVVTPPDLSRREKKAVTMLVEEVEERSGIRWPIRHDWPVDQRPVVAVGPASSARSFAGPYAPEVGRERGRLRSEGYHVRSQTAPKVPAVIIAGADSRGVLFGVGRLLRSLRMERGRIQLPEALRLTESPRTRLRGHQLGYRPKTNSYDAWTPEVWEQYIRDLAMFGTNAVELIPPRSDDAPTSPHFPLPQMEMMARMSQILDDYGLDVWIWYPALDADYSDPKTVEFALNEWGEVFRKLPRVDAVLVPGGDPGHTPPGPLMALLEKQTQVLRRSHPKAEMWISPQGFTSAWMDEFIQFLVRNQPDWLSGVVHGPQVRVSLSQLRELVPKRYGLRLYPDITHSVRCQYPVPDWDLAFALTEGRECINPRPNGMRPLFAGTITGTVGFITYSEGCNDDVNKVIWSALGWNPASRLSEVLRDYSRVFLEPNVEDGFSQGLLALERNWEGPLLANESVETTLGQFRAMEQRASPTLLANWRFQQGLYRAYYDAYTRARLLHETDLEQQAMTALRESRRVGSLQAMSRATAILQRATTEPVAQDLRSRVFELGEALFKSIRMQLSVERYQAIGVERGANLDTIDTPLNNRLWLLERFAAARSLPDEPARIRAIETILSWTHAGPGGFYDRPGSSLQRRHLVAGPGLDRDPGCYEGTRFGFASQAGGRVAWQGFIETLYDQPLTMRWTGLEPDATYRLRVVYGPDNPQVKIRVDTSWVNGGTEYHSKPVPTQPLDYAGQIRVSPTGEITIRWSREPGLGSNGRGCQISEIWLMKVLN